MSVTRVLRTIKISLIKPHPTNQRIYGPADDGLVEDIRQYGLQVPPEITAEDSTLISGYRRLAACRKLGIEEVQCLVRHDLADPLDVETAIVMANRYREKTNDQKAAEVAWLAHIEEKKAERRKVAGLKRGTSIPVPRPVGERENIEEKRDHLENSAMGEALDIAGAAVGWSGDTAKAAIEVHEAIQAAETAGDTSKAADLRSTLNTEGVKPAHRKIKQPADGEVRDRLGNKVPGSLLVTFEGAEPYGSILARLGFIRREISELRITPAGSRLPQEAEFLVERLQNELRNGRPYCGCPTCQGHSSHNGVPCDMCRETGFLIEAQYTNLTTEQKLNIPVSGDGKQ